MVDQGNTGGAPVGIAVDVGLQFSVHEAESGEVALKLQLLPVRRMHQMCLLLWLLLFCLCQLLRSL